MGETTGTGEKLFGMAAGGAAVAAVFWISYAFDFRQFAVMRMTSQFDRYYELLLSVWALAAFGFLWSPRLRAPYLLTSAAVLGHVYAWAFLQVYFGTMMRSVTISALVTLAAVTVIFLLSREMWLRLVMFNAIVAAAVFPLAMQHTITPESRTPSEVIAPESDHPRVRAGNEPDL